MKKIFVLLLAAAMLLTLAACGGKDDVDKAGTDAGDTSAEAPQNAPETEAETAAAEPAEKDDATLVAELTEKIVGDWGFPGDGSSEDLGRLSFGADGTGAYKSVTGVDLTFSYVIHIDHRVYNNGEPYTENMFKIDYSDGTSEDFIFFFTDDGKLAFHNADNGGYSGVIDYISAFTKE